MLLRTANNNKMPQIALGINKQLGRTKAKEGEKGMESNSKGKEGKEDQLHLHRQQRRHMSCS